MKIRSYLKPYWLAISIALMLTITELIVELIQPLIISKIIDDGILKHDLTAVMKWGGVLLAATVVAFVSGITNSFYAAHVSQSFSYNVRKSLYEKVQSFSFVQFSKFPTSSLLTRLTNDIIQIQNTIFMFLRIAVRAPLLVMGSLILALFIHVKLALILFIAVPLIVIFLRWIMKKSRILFANVQTKLDGVNSVMRENLAGMRLIKAFLRRNHEVKRFTKRSEQLKKRTQTALRVTEATMPGILLVMNFSIMALLWFGAIEVNVGTATEGEAIALINYATRMMHGLSVISMIIMNLSRSQASASRVREVFEPTYEDASELDGDNSYPTMSGKIEFNEVSFRYPGKTAPVLDGITFQVNPGETIAILGATGSGKTSLFQLIPRLYDVQKGAVLIDDADVKTMTLESLRTQIGYVPQEALLFTGTIRENIAWGKEDATLEEIVEAARNAQIHETIQNLPLQYETVLGQRGVNLSGGQKQRISIARALVRKPKILLLDDSTSALDVRTEQQLLHALKRYECTVLMITQKISSTLHADTILLLEDGKLSAQGSHKQLLASSSLYKRIYKSQFGEEASHHVQGIR